MISILDSTNCKVCLLAGAEFQTEIIIIFILIYGISSIEKKMSLASMQTDMRVHLFHLRGTLEHKNITNFQTYITACFVI